MKYFLSFCRFFVGILFIFSGLIKANDPLGLSYKMQEFFELWGLTSLNDFTLIMSILMIAFEIIAGVAVLIGWQFKAFSWMLFSLIIFFTFLTGYAVISGKVRECGCFGDCIKLTSEQSFIKDLILFVLIGFLLINRNKIKSAFKPIVAILILLVTTVASFGLQVYVLTNLPLIDCLPYKKGVVIQEKMKIPAGAIPDSTVINFVYQKEGKEVEFDAEHFPADFNDSTYIFVKRYDKLIREGNAKPDIKDFVIITQNEVDTTNDILQTEGKIYILFAKSIKESSSTKKLVTDIKNISTFAKNASIPMIAVSSDAANLNLLLSSNGINIPVCKGDLVAIKTAARSNPTLYLLEKGRIIDKWGSANFKEVSKN
jgi:uncharacterized membrane protein YphA (DoxX/SURF4 family)